MLEDKFYAGGEFLPEQYDDHRAARARRRQENAELEGFGKVRRPWGWVMSGDRVSVDGFVTNADGVVCGIHEKEIAVRLDDGTREWWPLWAIGLPNTSRAETVEANP